VQVPKEAATGSAKVTFSMIGWEGHTVAPATYEIEVKSASEMAVLEKKYPKRL
jgi:hypothetical protein